MAQGRYLVPTENTELQPYALAPLQTVELKQESEDQWRLKYNMPWTLAGFHQIEIDLEGPLHDLRSPNEQVKANCTDQVTLPHQLTLNLGQDFNPKTMCFVEYSHNLSVLLDELTGDFLDLVHTNFPSEEAFQRSLLRLDFMGDPVGFIGID